MKYIKPQLHSISAASAEAHCVSGSGASGAHVCTVGSGVKFSACIPGTVAIGVCNAGNTADNCAPVGSGVGLSCNIGTSPVA